jgi:hypothetical protein
MHGKDAPVFVPHELTSVKLIGASGAVAVFVARA